MLDGAKVTFEVVTVRHGFRSFGSIPGIDGRGICNKGGIVNLTNSTVSDNNATSGGGI